MSVILSKDSLKPSIMLLPAMQPFRHCVFTDVFDPTALKQVRDEIINNIEATYKETDIFKVCRYP